MRFFHYSTWYGEEAIEERLLKPHQVFEEDTHLCPPLLFLTSNTYWEPSVQAESEEGNWVKKPSGPDCYRNQGIPVYRFTVRMPRHHANLIYPHPLFIEMLKDGKKLGANLAQWRWTTESLPFIKVERFSRITLDWEDNIVYS